MTRPLKPLSAYPAQLRRLAAAAMTDESIFPLRIPFPLWKEAFAFRVLFYTYRRTLRSHIERADSNKLSPDFLLEAQGAELIQSPRIPTSPDAPNGQFYCIFRLSTDSKTTQSGLAVLDALLSTSKAPSTDEPASPLSDASALLHVDGVAYSIPHTELGDNATLATKQLELMLRNNLLELTSGRSIDDFIV